MAAFLLGRSRRSGRESASPRRWQTEASLFLHRLQARLQGRPRIVCQPASARFAPPDLFQLCAAGTWLGWTTKPVCRTDRLNLSPNSPGISSRE